MSYRMSVLVHVKYFKHPTRFLKDYDPRFVLDHAWTIFYCNLLECWTTCRCPSWIFWFFFFWHIPFGNKDVSILLNFDAERVSHKTDTRHFELLLHSLFKLLVHMWVVTREYQIIDVEANEQDVSILYFNVEWGFLRALNIDVYLEICVHPLF